MGTIRATNVSSTPLVLKIKTTSPDKYRVRPSMANLAPGKDCLIEIYAQQSPSAASLVRDKFLITAVAVDRADMDLDEVAAILKGRKADASYRLRCVLAAAVDGMQQQDTSSRRSGSRLSAGSEERLSKIEKKVREYLWRMMLVTFSSFPVGDLGRSQSRPADSVELSARHFAGPGRAGGPHLFAPLLAHAKFGLAFVSRPFARRVLLRGGFLACHPHSGSRSPGLYGRGTLEGGVVNEKTIT